MVLTQPSLDEGYDEAVFEFPYHYGSHATGFRIVRATFER